MFPGPFVVFPFQFQNHHVAGSFLEPVHEQLCPNYHHYIKYPIGEEVGVFPTGGVSHVHSHLTFLHITDLSTMSSRLASGYYKSVWLFIADMRRMFHNSRRYNELMGQPEQVRMTNTLERFFTSKMKDANAWINIAS